MLFQNVQNTSAQGVLAKTLVFGVSIHFDSVKSIINFSYFFHIHSKQPGKPEPDSSYLHEYIHMCMLSMEPTDYISMSENHEF